jgi:D-aspartate ligase
MAPPAIILDGSVNGLSFVRSLGRRRVPTLMLDSDRLIGTYTRFGKVILLRPADEHPQEWIDLLQFLGSRLNAPGILFPASDVYCLLVSQHAEILRRHFRFIVPDPETVERIVNKRLQYGIAQAAGTPIPRTYFPESVEEVRRLSADVPYPCLLKPYKSHIGRRKLGKKVVVVHSPAELISEYARVSGGDTLFMVQEIIPGGDHAIFDYLAFWGAEGRELAWLTKRKLRQYPPLYGDSSLHITVEAPEVAALSRSLLRTINYRGFVGVEFKFDARDHTYRLMEVNARTHSSNQLAISAGVDFPWIGYQYLAGFDPGSGTPSCFRPGVKGVNEEWDVQAYLTLRKSGSLTLGSWLRSLRGTKARAIGAWDDPLPLAVGLWRFLQAFFRNLRPPLKRLQHAEPNRQERRFR